MLSSRDVPPAIPLTPLITPLMCTACGAADYVPVALAPPADRSFAALRNPDCRFYLLGVLLPMMEGERF